MRNQLAPEEVHAVIKALSDLYVEEGKGHFDRTLTAAGEHLTSWRARHEDAGVRPAR